MENRLRKSFKVDHDTHPDDIEKEMRRIFGNDSIVISDEEKKRMVEVFKSKSEILNIINPHYDNLVGDESKESSKKKDELVDLGKFIFNYKGGEKINIIGIEESPDFILSVDDRRVGVEHTRLINTEIVSDHRNITKVLKQVQAKIAHTEREIKGLLSLSIDVERISINGKTLNQLLQNKDFTLHQEIEKYILDYFKNADAVKPHYIVEVTYFDSTDLHIALAENYFLEELAPQKIIALIENKESKIMTYKNNFGLSEVWLFIVFDGASEYSSFNIKLKELPTIDTAFDRVYIFNTFLGSYFHLNR